MAMIAMAGECARRRTGMKTLKIRIEDVIRLLQDRQLPNGSFDDNVVSTALAIQAMKLMTDLSFNPPKGTTESAMKWLRSAQHPDGSFGDGSSGDILSTTEALLALSSLNGRANIRSGCDIKDVNALVRFGSKTSLPQISVQFVMLSGYEPVSKMIGIDLKLPVDTNVFLGLETAARKDDRFKYIYYMQYVFTELIDSHRSLAGLNSSNSLSVNTSHQSMV